jgi:hypothetical protein
MVPFNVLTATASEPYELVKNGTSSSVDMAPQSLPHIEKNNARLHALGEIAPEECVLSFAR